MSNFKELGNEFMLVYRKCRVGGTAEARIYNGIDAAICFIKHYIKMNVPTGAKKLLKGAKITDMVDCINEYTDGISLSVEEIKKIENLYNDRGRRATKHEIELIDRFVEDSCRLC